MANAEQLALIRRSLEEWNAWRHKNPTTIIDLKDADLRGMDLTGADLGRAYLCGADLSGTCLSGANLVLARLVRTVLRDADLHGASLNRAGLAYADLHGANLREARFVEATLAGADLREAKLNGANLHWARLNDADLRGTDLTGAYLIETHLMEAYFFQTKLSGATFRGARLRETTFADVNLSGVLHLDTCLHGGPSVIDVRTLTQSAPLPISFLRGCGLPDSLITYLPSLLSDGAIQFYSCFISYSTKDQEFADRLYADLQNKGVRCWFAPHDVQAGKKLHEQIDAAIRMHERVLLILSPNSMNSKWVKTEIRNARKRELAEKKRVLFPVRLMSYEALRDWKLFDADEGEDLAVEIREYYIPDFSQWKNHDLYMKEFEKLLRDLRADANAREKPPMPRL